jgi:hypothetical protein
MNDKALVPVEQKTVVFYGDELVAIRAEDGQIYVSFRHLCNALGLDRASQISQAVKAVAMKLSEQSGRNEYGGVYGELYRKFSITSYKLLPAKKFEEAMNWLTEWHQSMVGDEPF